MPPESQAVVRRLYEELWNHRRLEVANEVISPSHALHDPHLIGSAVGPEAYKRVCTQFIAAFPDLRFTVEDYISEEDKVVARWVISGTHKREFLGVPATNKKISVEGVTIHQIANGKIIDSYLNLDYFGLMEQLGVPSGTGHSKGVAVH